MSKATLTIFAVGRANRIYFECDDKSAYFDAGGLKSSGSPSSAYFFFLTHWHLDHYSFMTQRGHSCTEAFVPFPPKNNPSIVNGLYAVQASAAHVNFVPSSPNTIEKLNPQISVECWPNIPNSTNDINNQGISYVLCGITGWFSCNKGSPCNLFGDILFPGDTRYDLIAPPKKPIQMMVVPHHGSEYSVATLSCQPILTDPCCLFYSTSYDRTRVSKSLKYLKTVFSFYPCCFSTYFGKDIQVVFS